MRYEFRETVSDSASGKTFKRHSEYDESEIPVELMPMLKKERLIVEVAATAEPKQKPKS